MPMSYTHCVAAIAPWRTHCGLQVESSRVRFDDPPSVTCEVCRTMGRLHRLARGDATERVKRRVESYLERLEAEPDWVQELSQVRRRLESKEQGAPEGNGPGDAG